MKDDVNEEVISRNPKWRKYEEKLSHEKKLRKSTTTDNNNCNKHLKRRYPDDIIQARLRRSPLTGSLLRASLQILTTNIWVSQSPSRHFSNTHIYTHNDKHAHTFRDACSFYPFFPFFLFYLFIFFFNFPVK